MGRNPHMWLVVCKTGNHAEYGPLFEFAILRLAPGIGQKKCDIDTPRAIIS